MGRRSPRRVKNAARSCRTEGHTLPPSARGTHCQVEGREGQAADKAAAEGRRPRHRLWGHTYRAISTHRRRQGAHNRPLRSRWLPPKSYEEQLKL